MMRRPPRSTLFLYTTLFRSVAARRERGAGVAGGGARVVEPADVEEGLGREERRFRGKAPPWNEPGGRGGRREPEIVGFRIARSLDTRREGAVRLSSGFDEALSFQVRFVGGGREREKVSVFLRGRPGRKRQQVGRWPEHRLEGGSFLDGGGQPTE